jgi:hypothetical protein
LDEELQSPPGLSSKQLRAEADRQDEAAFWRGQYPEAPSPEALRRHMSKFGPDSVEHVATLYGVDPNGSSSGKPRTGNRLKPTQSKRAAARARLLVDALL